MKLKVISKRARVPNSSRISKLAAFSGIEEETIVVCQEWKSNDSPQLLIASDDSSCQNHQYIMIWGVSPRYGISVPDKN
jgi:hypothetical protein